MHLKRPYGNKPHKSKQLARLVQTHLNHLSMECDIKENHRQMEKVRQRRVLESHRVPIQHEFIPLHWHVVHHGYNTSSAL